MAFDGATHKSPINHILTVQNHFFKTMQRNTFFLFFTKLKNEANNISSYISNIKLDYNGHVSLIDGKGTILATPNQSLLFASLKSTEPQLFEDLFTKTDRESKYFYARFSGNPKVSIFMHSN